MIAKGHDFPFVTLVGILDADMSLHFSDYRSHERTYQLITQVSGRAGRSDLAGEVVIQTYNPEHYSIRYAKRHDYLSFYKEDMNIRKKLNYPPYYNLCLIKLVSTDYNLLSNESNKIKNYLENTISASAEKMVGNVYKVLYIGVKSEVADL